MLVDLYAAPYTAAALITTTVLALLYGRERKKTKRPHCRNVRLPGGEKCVVSGVASGFPGHEEKSLRPEQFCSPKGRHKLTRKGRRGRASRPCYEGTLLD